MPRMLSRPLHLRAVLSLVVALLVAVFALGAQAADPLPKPTGPVILTIAGNIAVTNSDKGAQFDRAMLAQLGMSTLSTSTSWTDGVQLFEGVLARTVLERVGAKGTKVIATALNDFASPVPMAEFIDYDVLLATKMNGVEMQVSDKGPVWIIYPKDENPELQDARYNDRWVWQLKQLTVTE